jgi:D(-)-tartrate dehydratase
VKILEVREAMVSIGAPISNAYVDFREMTASIVAVITDVERDGQRVVGYGFNSNGRYGVGGLLRERFIPRLIAASPSSLCDATGDNLDPQRVYETLMRGEKPGGHGERAVAVGTLDMAVWDAIAKIQDAPLYAVLSERYGAGTDDLDRHVYVYAACGYYEAGKATAGLQDELRSYLDLGYESVKIKVGGASIGDDLDRIEAALDVLDGDGSRLAVDANGRFELDAAIAFGQAIQPYGLKWYEEAGDPLDYDLQARLGDTYSGPFATGENLFAMAEVRNLVRYARLDPQRDFLQFDCALSYGVVEYVKTLRMLAEHGWSPRRCIPHGGHQMSLHLAVGLGLAGNESYPNVFQPFGGFSDHTPVTAGHIELTDAPGIGFESKANLIGLFRKHFST